MPVDHLLGLSGRGGGRNRDRLAAAVQIGGPSHLLWYNPNCMPMPTNTQLIAQSTIKSVAIAVHVGRPHAPMRRTTTPSCGPAEAKTAGGTH